MQLPHPAHEPENAGDDTQGHSRGRKAGRVIERNKICADRRNKKGLEYLAEKNQEECRLQQLRRVLSANKRNPGRKSEHNDRSQQNARHSILSTTHEPLIRRGGSTLTGACDQGLANGNHSAAAVIIPGSTIDHTIGVLTETFMSLTGRVALVTGASQGIGRTCALRLAKDGATVAVVARNQEKLNELVSEITAAGGKATAFALDVGEEEQVKSSVKSAIAQFGKIDILVNNAGITRDQLVMRMKRADWDSVLQTNLTSAYLCIQQVIGSMLKQRWGRIINITSVFGQMGQAGQANYAASKAGLIGLTMAIAREVGSRNITCNAVAPGFIETAMTSGLSDEFKQTAVKQIPLGRVGSPEDVASAVAFLASDEASYITGHVLNVNGGMLMG
jgi:3-oxoacyl-[acyl-carrier protein] reductase